MIDVPQLGRVRLQARSMRIIQVETDEESGHLQIGKHKVVIYGYLRKARGKWSEDPLNLDIDPVKGGRLPRDTEPILRKLFEALIPAVNLWFKAHPDLFLQSLSEKLEEDVREEQQRLRGINRAAAAKQREIKSLKRRQREARRLSVQIKVSAKSLF